MPQAQPPIVDPDLLAALLALAHDRLDRTGPDHCVVLGISGSQGSGKTTLARALATASTAQGIATACLSLDDLYLTRAERLELSAKVHPLLATRGVPGTHDVSLGLRVIDALDRGETVVLPRFDKARDDRRPPAETDRVPAGTRLLIFEGWCLGARPEPAETLARAVNALETEADADGRWRTYVNDVLGGPYAALWARIDALVLLRAPDFETVVRWRQEQERALRAQTRAADGSTPGIMDDEGVRRFVAFYERITRNLLAEREPRADLIVSLDAARHPVAMTVGSGTTGSGRTQ